MYRHIIRWKATEVDMEYCKSGSEGYNNYDRTVLEILCDSIYTTVSSLSSMPYSNKCRLKTKISNFRNIQNNFSQHNQAPSHFPNLFQSS
jgi:hypothetical protein